MRLLVLLSLCLAVPAAAQAPGPPPDRFDEPSDAPSGEAPPPVERGASGSLMPAGRWAYGPAEAIAGSASGISFLGAGGVIRVVDGATQSVVGEVVLPGIVTDFALDGARLYASVRANRAGTGGLFALDVSDPTQPTVVGALDGSSIYGIARRGSHLFLLAASPSRLLVADVSDPTQPSLVGSLSLPGIGRNLDVVGDRAYVAVGTAGLSVVDVSVPAAPVLTQTLALAGSVRRVEASVLLESNVLAVAAGDAALDTGTLYLFDISGPSLTLRSSLSLPGVAEDVAWMPIRSDGQRTVLVATSEEGVYSIGVSPPSTLYVNGRAYPYWANLAPKSIRVEAPAPGERALVADAFTGWQTVNWASFDALLPFSIGPAGGSAVHDVLPDADDPSVLWAAVGALGLVRFDAAASGGPAETARTRGDYWNFSYDLAQVGGLLYVADGYSGVWVVEKATGAVVARLGDLPFCNRVEVVGSVLVATGQGEMAVYRIDAPEAPVYVSGGSAGDAFSLAHAGAVLYAGGLNAARVEAVDVSVPASPMALPGFNAPGVAVLLDAEGERLYVQASNITRVYDVSAPGTPQQLGQFSAPAYATAVRGTHYYAAISGSGALVAAYDATDPSGVSLVASANFEAGAPFEMAATAGRVFVGTGTAGLYAFSDATVAGESTPAASRLAVAAGPNPSRGAVAVTVRLPSPSALRVDVLDALGRRVATLADGAHAAGTVALSWDARGLPAGVYTVRATAGADVALARVTHLP